MISSLLNWTTAGMVAAALALPPVVPVASAQRSRGGAPATGGAVARNPAPPAAPSPAPAAPATGRAETGGSSSGTDGQSRGGQTTGGTRSRGGSGGNRGGGGQASGRVDGTGDSQRRAGADQNRTGQAVERRPGSGHGGGNTIIVPGGGYYYPWYPWGWAGLGFGGYYGGYYGGLYDPLGYGGYGYGADQGGGYASGSDYNGALHLKVKPRDASVFIDGYLAGQVDDYDGTFQRLHVEPGPHRVEITAEGYEPLTFEVRIQPDRTVTYRGELKKLP